MLNTGHNWMLTVLAFCVESCSASICTKWYHHKNCCELPEALAGGVEKCPEDQPLPIFISHGTEDPMIPVVRAQESNERLLSLGYAPVYREYAMQHEIRPEALRDMVGFLDEKVLGNPLYSA